MSKENATILTSKIFIKPDSLTDFVDWQAKLNAKIAVQPGFISLEILSPSLPEQPAWLVMQRFYTSEDAASWQQSEIRKSLMAELEKYEAQESIHELFSSGGLQGGVTEVFITQVEPENEKAYRDWIAKIHQAEAKFPGFRGVYMQSPGQSGSLNWITLLQFDTPDHLDRWLNSDERQKIIEEGKALIRSLDTHRMISPYAGWFASVAKRGKLPPVWKQTMIILLVLFPIVCLELKYLSLWTATLNRSLGTFISNAISVSLISWPCMPIAIFFLRWWLTPSSERKTFHTILGTVIILLLYIGEIALFWNFL